MIAGLKFSKVTRDTLGRKVFAITQYGHRVAQAVADDSSEVYILDAPQDATKSAALRGGEAQ